LLFVKLIEDDIPEPLDKLVFWVEWLDVFGYSLELLKVKVFGPTDELLKLLRAI
jgi:hypothetical protein